MKRALKTKLVDLADFQDNSIVSQRIIQKSAGNVTFFAFDKGQELSTHTAPFDALVYAAEGTVKITISGKSQKLSAGEIIILPADEPHALKALTPFKMMLVMIKKASA